MAKIFRGAPPLELLLFLACPIENSKILGGTRAPPHEASKKFWGGGDVPPKMYGRTAYEYVWIIVYREYTLFLVKDYLST